jgi:mono/diheme cytochrome c family protein
MRSTLAQWFTLLGLALASSPTWAADELPDFARGGRPFVEKHCLACHGGKEPQGELSLEPFRDAASVSNCRKVWSEVLKRVESGDMPPEDRPRPAPEEVNALTKAVREVLDYADRHAKPDPGRVTMRRLNRTEYKNTIRDLVGVDFDPTEDFPSDDVGYGFDNIGDVLTLSPVLMERYLAAAESIVQRATLACTPDKPQAEQTREVLRRFALRAYRRPPTGAEVERLVRLVTNAEAAGESWEAGVQGAVQAALCSPKFLFRVELDDRPDGPETRPLDEFQLASRLSYFLWSTMPDDALFALAEKQQLIANLEGQVRRLLQDPRSRALVQNFALQWLQIQRLRTAAPDAQMFPNFNDRLRTAMLKETELFFESVLREDRSILDLLDADYTFVNGPLARHYGIADTNGNGVGQKPERPGGQPIRGEEFQRVALQGRARGGLLTQASVLTVTSNPTRTSPVKRGRWVLEQILGEPPPPPPPKVPELPNDAQAVTGASLRQRMEVHRQNPSCANCHAKMDPIGFALENYDAIGAFRTKDGKFDIDASGQFPDGRTFRGAEDLKSILKEQQQAFSRCLAEKMLIYALGRGLEHYDRPTIDRIALALEREHQRFSTLVLEIVKSDPFRLRRGSTE